MKIVFTCDGYCSFIRPAGTSLDKRKYPWWESCQDLAPMFKDFLACGFTIFVQAQLIVHPFCLQSPLILASICHPTTKTPEALGVVLGMTLLGEVSNRPAPQALKHLNQTLLSICEHLRRRIRENYYKDQPILNIFWVQRNSHSLEKCVAAWPSLFCFPRKERASTRAGFFMEGWFHSIFLYFKMYFSKYNTESMH